MKKKNARPSKAESSAVEQRQFTPKARKQSRPATIIAVEYEGMAVSFTGDGWFNATVPAARFRKAPHEWLRLPATHEYLDALERKYGKIPYSKTKRGNDGGTWMHPKLAVPFARWLDVDFAVWCDEQIDHILRGGLTVWQKAGGALSDTSDREPLLTVAAAIVSRHQLPFSSVYEALNHFAGVACARNMSCDQVMEAAEFGSRLLAGNATVADFAQIDRNRVRLGITSEQFELLGGAQ